MTSEQQVLVNKQFNSPIKLYSPANVADVLSKQRQILANGAVGIDFHQLATPANLANSAVLRMLEEEERQRGGVAKDDKSRRPVRRFEWPPRHQDGSHGNDDGVDFKHRSHYFSTFPLSTTPGLKRIAWPPPPEDQDLIEEQPVYSKGPAFGDSIQATITRQPQKTWNPPSSPQATQQQQQQQQQQKQPPPQPQGIQSPPPVHAPVYQPIPFQPPPTTVVLRPQAPVSEEPHPIFESQPAATKGEGPRMRGDEKWPPAEHKARAQAENEARVALARGPAVRPRKVKRDYTTFFAQNALTPNYPTYKAPPGTQHYVEDGTSNF